MKLFNNKKGDLSLSVNAIVILVIAIIFLGLAIGFTTKLIGNSKDKLMTGIDNVEITTPANAENPIVFDGKLEVKADGQTPMKISVYNIDSSQLTGAKPSISECYKDDGTVAAPLPVSIITAPATVLAYKEQRYQAILKATSGVTAADFICKIIVTATTGSSSIKKQVTIKITG